MARLKPDRGNHDRHRDRGEDRLQRDDAEPVAARRRPLRRLMEGISASPSECYDLVQ